MSQVARPDTTSIRISTINHRRINDFKAQKSYWGPSPQIDDVIDEALDLLFAKYPHIQDRAKLMMTPEPAHVPA